jgi:hypothetical protein
VHSTTTKLRESLRKAGISDQAVEAAWPAWWSEDADASTSARAELRFALARKLGVSPKALSDDRVEFVWYDRARFKHLSDEGAGSKAILASFGISIGRHLLQATRNTSAITVPSAEDLRKAILENSQFIDLTSLVGMCWACGIPIIHLRVFPLTAKAMHAMVVKADGRYAILLARDAEYPAPVAFTVAHEIGHIGLAHLGDDVAIIDLDDPLTASDAEDNEEAGADRYALSLLTGSPEPDIQANIEAFGARQLAQAVLDAGPRTRIEPGTLALCYAYRTNNWAKAMASLQYIYAQAKPVWHEVNSVATNQLDWTSIGDDVADFLRNVMGIPNE